MYHPTTRVLALLELLQTHGRMSGAELAPRLGVDRRTLRRYVGKLEDIGIPITAERGRAGGYALMPGFKLPPMMFTEDETLALSLGLLAARGLGLAEAAPAVASAQAKLERVMPDGLKRRVRAVDETVKLDAARVIAPAGNRASNRALVALTDAAQACRRVVLRYRDQQGEASVRRFDSYGVALRHGRWYVAGMCHLRQALRTFRLDRVEDVEGFRPWRTRCSSNARNRLRGAFVCRWPMWCRRSPCAAAPAIAIEVLLKTERCRARLFDDGFQREQLGRILAAADQVHLLAVDQHLGRAAAGVVVRGHRETVGAGRHHGQQVARLDRPARGRAPASRPIRRPGRPGRT
jgi:predicted DNA-binding transcriptional regulator YafY